MLLGRALFVLTFLGSFSLIACSPTTTETAATSEPCADCIDAGTEDTPGLDATVLGFDATRFSFTGSENRRTNDIAASFPVAGTYDRITLTLSLACPDQKCDPWDRAGTLGLVVDEGGAGTDDDKVIELARFMTPYGVGGSWTYDLTDLRPLFRGPLKLRAFIDTWVGPGSAYGNGWALTTSIEFHGGIPARTPIAVIPLWQHSVDGSVVVGDPEKPLATSLPDFSVTLPASTSAVAVRTLVTGHGQGNQGNCAEFCKLNHTTSATTRTSPRRGAQIVERPPLRANKARGRCRAQAGVPVRTCARGPSTSPASRKLRSRDESPSPFITRSPPTKMRAARSQATRALATQARVRSAPVARTTERTIRSHSFVCPLY